MMIELLFFVDTILDALEENSVFDSYTALYHYLTMFFADSRHIHTNVHNNHYYTIDNI